ncbi:MAG: histidinol dehydrogenase [Saprospiraceae bacterium]|nr:histidinol dehydrogenase [Saprospiraceae bacterium]
MKVYKYPTREEWNSLLERPSLDRQSLQATINTIFEEVEKKGDMALKAFTLKFDDIWLDEIQVSQSEIIEGSDMLDLDLKQAIDQAYDNILAFHKSQIISEEKVETMKGVTCWRKSLPIENVGLYIPGGSAPLFSSLLMLGIPAMLAGCKNILVCTPPQKNGQVHDALLYTAKKLGITKMYKIGGGQAIAAMALGTSTINRVDKIYGPGNQYVTEAKQFATRRGIAIDMPAGPSELLVLADSSANPSFIASDLLSQAEHGPDSQVILATDNLELAENTLNEVYTQLKALPRKDMAEQALANSKVILLSQMDECIALSNQYAPEHLIVASENAEQYIDRITSAGSVFLGNYSCESAGDYCSGTNHTLPTNGYARSHSGVSMDSFYKKVTFQKITKEGMRNLGPTIERLAEAENLFAHKNAASIRLKSLGL